MTGPKKSQNSSLPCSSNIWISTWVSELDELNAHASKLGWPISYHHMFLWRERGHCFRGVHFFLFCLGCLSKFESPKKSSIDWFFKCFRVILKWILTWLNLWKACKSISKSLRGFSIQHCYISICIHISNTGFSNPVVGNQSSWITKPGSFTKLSTVKNLIFKIILPSRKQTWQCNITIFHWRYIFIHVFPSIVMSVNGNGGCRFFIYVIH